MGNTPSNQNCRVVVVGGGYGGVAVVRGLLGKVNLTLIEAHDRMLHNVAAPRAITQPTEEAVWIPYDKFLQGKATHVKGIATAINTDTKVVTVQPTAGGEPVSVPYDILVVATGAASGLFKAHLETTAAQSAALLRALRERVATASSVAVIGGGALGVEVVAEIASAFPKGSKQVHLIHRGAALLSNAAEYGELPAPFKAAAQTYLTGTLGVTVKTGASVDIKAIGSSLPAGTRVEDGGRLFMTPEGSAEKINIPIADGSSVQADVVIVCAGGTVNKSAYASSPAFASIVDAAGRIKVDNHLRVEGQAAVFALGDCAATPDPKLAFTAGKKHAPVVVKNVLALAASLSPPAKGTPPKLAAHKFDPRGACALALGQKKAIGQIGPTRLPDFIVTMLKAKDLMLGQATKDMGYKTPGVFPGAAPLLPAKTV